MKKIIFSLLLLLVLSVFYTFQPLILKKDIQSVVNASEVKTHEWFKSKVLQYEVIRCSFGVNNLVNAFIYEDRIIDDLGYHIQFYDVSRDNLFVQNFDSKYIGATSVENTTYSILLEMVEQDCSQFQQAKGDINDETINWSYSPLNPDLFKVIQAASESEDDQPVSAEELEKEIQYLLENDSNFRETIERRKKAQPNNVVDLDE